jgi:Na+-transporting NADH:ubiquinone oxidoreductase subunit C
MKKGILYTVIFMILLSFSFVFLLSLGNGLTKERTEHNAVIAFRKAVLQVFQVAFRDNDEAYSLFDSVVEKKEKNGMDLYEYGAGKRILYAVVFSGSGLWGTIEGVLGVDANLQEIVGVEILNHNETPGLGGRIEEQAFRDQFNGERIGGGAGIGMTKKGAYDYDHENGTVDGITGATQTSQRLKTIINETLQQLSKTLEKDNG